MADATAILIANHAVHFFHAQGWNFLNTCPVSIKLIHPQGAKKFLECGVTFIDVFDQETAGFDCYVRLCLLGPGQSMPLHHHRLREERFEVISGTVRLLGEFPRDSRTLEVGGQMCPKIGELHGVEAREQQPVAYVGLCHKEHLRDVYWEGDNNGGLTEVKMEDIIPLHRPPTKEARIKLHSVLNRLRETQ